MKWVKYGILIFIAVAIVGAIAYGFMPKPVEVETARATTGDLVVTIDEEGVTRVKDRFTIMVPVAGNIPRIEFEAGDEVAEGQAIVVLSPVTPMLLDARELTEAKAGVAAAEAGLSQAAAAVRSAQAEAEFATAEHERMKKLYQSKHVTKEQLDAAATKDEAASAALESATFGRKAAQFQLEMAEAALITGNEEADVQEISIESPVAGRILRVFREDEGTVQAGQALVEIGNPGSLEVVVDLLSRDAVRVNEDKLVDIVRWGGEATLKGKVRRVEPQGFTKISALGVEEQRVNVIVDFTEPAAAATLGDAYRVEARIHVNTTSGVVTVPTSALFKREGTEALFLVKDGKASLVHVQVGLNNGMRAEIQSGVNADDQVIVHPSDDVTDGVRIRER